MLICHVVNTSYIFISGQMRCYAYYYKNVLNDK